MFSPADQPPVGAPTAISGLFRCGWSLVFGGAKTIGKLAKRPAEVGYAGVIEINRESVRSSPYEFCAPEGCQASRNFSTLAVRSYRDYHFRRFELLQICE